MLELPAAFPGWEYDADQNALVSLANEDAPALWLNDGKLWTTNPSEDTLTAMIAFAGHLGARVRGDELETYRTATETYLHPDDTEAKAHSSAKTRALIRRARFKSFVLHVAIFGSFALLVVVFAKLGWLK